MIRVRQPYFKGNMLYQKKGYFLELQGPGDVVLDSVLLEGEALQNFQLSSNMNAEGHYLYNMVEKDAKGKILSKDPIPVVIEDPKLLQILMVNSFPTFETKYLKNYLAEEGHQVLVRSKITTGKFKTENYNREKGQISTFSEANLETFDLLIIDANCLDELGRGERRALENSIRDKGLGVFIQPNANYFKTGPGIFSFTFFSDSNKVALLDKDHNHPISKNPFSFKADVQLTAWHTSDSNILSAYKNVGRGSIGTTVLENTYELLLQGEQDIYQGFWSKIINSIGKRAVPTVDWSDNILLAFKDQLFDFKFRTAENKPSIKANEGYSISIQEDVAINGLWKGITYPRNVGWQKLYMEEDTTSVLTYYSTDMEYWKGVRVFNNQVENKRNFKAAIPDKTRSKVLTPVPRILFFLLFILGMGYLWLVPKLK